MLVSPMSALKLSFIFFTISLFIFGYGVFSDHGLSKSRQLQLKIKAGRDINNGLQTQKILLESKIRKLQSSTPTKYIQNQIRRELGYIKSEEMIMIFPTHPKKSH